VKKKFLKTCMVLIILTLLLGTFTVASASDREYILQVLAHTNNERAQHGAPQLIMDPLLNDLAAVRAREIAHQYEGDREQRVRPDGQRVTRWVLDEGAGRFLSAGENIAFGTSSHMTASRAVQTWMNSSEYRRNLLSQSVNFTHIGIGFHSEDGRYYWVQLFAVAGGTQPAAQPPRIPVNLALPAIGTPIAQLPTLTVPVAPPVAGTPVAQLPALAVSVAPPAAGAAIPQTIITTANAASMTQQAIQASAPGNTVVVSAVNQSAIELAAMRVVAAAAPGRTVRIQADTRTSAGLDVRIVVPDPSAATRGINLAASTTSAEAVRVQNIFMRSHNNAAMTVVSMGQQGDFGMEVRVVTRIDPVLDANNLYFYSYNLQTNTFRRFTPSAVSMDANGFLHFTTTMADNIVISDTRF